jgi:hypothetical protein
VSKKTLLTQDPARIVNTERRDKAERNAAPCRAQIENQVPEPRIKNPRKK